MKRTIKDYLAIGLKGIGMGAADVVPGVSGGTIAFITGIYEELIDSIKSINLKALKLLFTGKLKEFWKAINGNFLLSLEAGILISVLSLAKLLKFLLETYPILVWAFFFGLIVASAIFVARSIKKWNYATIIAAIAGTIISLLITIISPAEANTSYPFIFISGAIAITAMILPGISGSFILVLLGMYKFILGSISDMKILVIGTFMAGAGFGIIAFSNVLSWLLKKYHDITIAVLAGFMVGSLNKVWPWKEVTKTFTDRHGELRPLEEISVLPARFSEVTNQEAMVGGAIALAIVGFALILVVEKITEKIDIVMKTFGLIGYRLGYSFSKGFFTEKFEKEKLTEHEYVNFELDSINEFPAIFESNPGISGLNCTIPYKQEIMPFMDEIDSEAAEVGAVNTVKITREGKQLKLKGYNSDVYGFENSLKPMLSEKHKKALILGTGGASKAIKFILTKLGIEYISASIEEELFDKEIRYEQINEQLIKEHLIIINATPLGTFPNVDNCANIPYDFISSDHVLYDLVYNPEETLFMKKGIEKGATVKNGLEMLHLQAKRSWEIWNS